MKKHKPETQLEERAVIWICSTCANYNMHPLDVTDFECVACGARYYAEACCDCVERPK